MRALLPITTDDLPPHIQDLRTAELSLFIVRGDALAGELTITSLAHTASGQTVTTSEMTTSGGIISTRRPAGAPWQVLRHRDQAGTCENSTADDDLIRSWFRDELLEDLVLVITLSGTTPVWP